ncbi:MULTISPECIES: TIGR02300 family protein [Kaistia]|uniref:TIGR02300 family protein n=1 Tax=Kaistia nematophila TaxID=2994654 RepID=A0A9X3DXZ1_9HYPH|nr:TIGR02300 family protein [Kaistia nematophila]
MAKAELGTKRVDPETGKKFYDLNKDPIVSPFTGVSYPRSFFESGTAPKARPANVTDDEDEEIEDEGDKSAEFVSLEEADEETSGGAIAVEGDEDDVELADDDGDDVFIEDEEEEGDDVTDIIGGVDDEES